MTRPLHPKTKVQRATDKRKQSAAKRRQGFEDSDEPPSKVALGIAGFFGLLFTGLAAAAVTVGTTAPRGELGAPKVSPIVFPNASLPPLLAQPQDHRRAIEAQAQRNLAAQQLAQAMRSVESRQGATR